MLFKFSSKNFFSKANRPLLSDQNSNMSYLGGGTGGWGKLRDKAKPGAHANNAEEVDIVEEPYGNVNVCCDGQHRGIVIWSIHCRSSSSSKYLAISVTSGCVPF